MDSGTQKHPFPGYTLGQLEDFLSSPPRPHMAPLAPEQRVKIQAEVDRRRGATKAAATPPVKPGTKIETHGYDMQFKDTWEPATIARRKKGMGELPSGYHPVKFRDGGILIVHENRFRIVNPKKEG